ncbi:hypothetical protein [Nocardiopsis dassonvillei]|uniref:hypothetical protein n=1 Tax=Nocardiopsis dassonvillei TaxID=2014 RepID=UPI003672D741
MTEKQNPSRKKEGHEPVPATVQEEELVQLTGKVPKSLRNRVKMAAISLDISSQEVQKRALEEWLDQQGL